MKENSISEILRLGISFDDATALRRISMTLKRWHELECGVSGGHVERDEKTGKPVFVSDSPRFVDPNDPRARWVIPDRETGALKRLAKIMQHYPSLKSFIQGDPRGCALYILRPQDVPDGADVSAYYSRGIAVY